MSNKYLAFGIGLIVLSVHFSAQASCGSTFCSINTSWDEHTLSRPGWSADLGYNYSRAGTLRSGSKEISADTSADEVENLRTINMIITAKLDYTHDKNWGVMLTFPFIIRDHNHNLGPYVGSAPAGYESFNVSALGDIKVVGRYRWTLDQVSHSGMGVKFGLKLSTGRKDFLMDTGFLPSEVALQPGNGSTDLILGVFWQQAHDGDMNWFVQATQQNSMRSIESFRPGNQFNLDAGMRYAFNSSLSGLLQLNGQWNSADSGSSASLTPTGESSSGGRIFSLSPGLSYAFTPSTQFYGLVQLPFYQYVNGEQLTADSSLTTGINHRF